MIEDESLVDLVLNYEPGFYIDWRGWLLLALMLTLSAWALWHESRHE